MHATIKDNSSSDDEDHWRITTGRRDKSSAILMTSSNS